MKRVNYFLIVFIVCLAGCAQDKNQPDPEEDIAAINALYDQYLESINTENLDEFIMLWDENATRSEPETPEVIGKENLWKHASKWFENDMTMDYASKTKVEVSGDLGYAIGVVTFSSTPKTGGETVAFDIKWLDILKRQEDGSWKIFIDCVNFQPVWSMDSIPEELTEGSNPYY